MKSYLSFALLGAVAFAGTPEEDDVAAKKIVDDKYNEGVTIGESTHAIGDQVSWDTGKGSVKVSTSWNRSGGSDSIDQFDLWWTFIPAATGYTPGEAVFEFFQASDNFNKSVVVTRHSSLVTATSNLHTYNWTTITDKNISQIITDKAVLSAAAETALTTTNKFTYSFANDIYSSSDKINDTQAWTISTKSKYIAKTGEMTTVLTRPNAGASDVKIGGATALTLAYKDKTITAWKVIGSAYIKWADDTKKPSPTTKQGATALTTYGAVVLAALYSLF